MTKLDKDTYYNGFAGEHYIISQFYAMKYEAAKMEMDYGYDLLVTNQYRRSSKQDMEVKTLALQIKTRSIKKKHYITREVGGLGLGEFARMEFFLKKADFELITSDSNAFLICVFVDEGSSPLNPVGTFWLSSKHLKELNDEGYLNDGKHRKLDNHYFITAELPLNQNVNHLTKFCIERLEKENIDSTHLEYLKNLLEESTVSIKQGFSDISLLNIDATTCNYSNSKLVLKPELTNLKKISDSENISLKWTEDEHRFLGNRNMLHAYEKVNYKKLLFDLDLIGADRYL